MTLHRIGKYVKYIMNISSFLMIIFKLTHFLIKRKKKNIGFFSDTIKARCFKLCMIITLIGICIVIVGLMTLCFKVAGVRNINCKLHVLDSCPL